MKRFTLIALVAALAACREPVTPPIKVDSALDIGIVSGNHQISKNAVPLLQPVVGRVVRKADGKIGWINLMLPRYAHAQTTVNGSPVAGAVVCAVGVGASPLAPFVPCTNSDSSGHATFFFGTGTKAGQALAEIRGTLAGQPIVFDTATATVLPDSVASAMLTPASRDLGIRDVGTQIDLSQHVTSAKDRHGNDNGVWVARYTVSTDSLVGTILPSPLPALTDSGRVITVTAGARLLIFRVDKLVFYLKVRTP